MFILLKNSRKIKNKKLQDLLKDWLGIYSLIYGVPDIRKQNQSLTILYNSHKIINKL